MAEKFYVTGDQDVKIDKQMVEIKRQLRQKGGSPLNPELVAYALQKIIEGKFHGYSKKLKSIIIGACDGVETLAMTVSTDQKFDEWGLNKPGVSTDDTLVEVHEMVHGRTLVQIFGSFGVDLSELCLTQHQIKKFYNEYPELLDQNGGASLFLFKVDFGNVSEFFVADVRVSVSEYLSLPHIFVYANRLGDASNFGNTARVVVPQLTA